MSGLEIAPEPSGGPVAAALLERYFAELAARFPAFEHALIEAPPAEFAPPRGAFLVARLDGRAVGCGAVRLLDAATAEIKRMWVDPAARRAGVGSGLLAALEDAASALGARTARLDTAVHLTEALALYRARGYRDIPRYNDNPYGAHWLEKRLTPRRRA